MVLRGKCTALNTYVKRKSSLQIWNGFVMTEVRLGMGEMDEEYEKVQTSSYKMS